MKYRILDKVNSTKDLKKLSMGELATVAEDVRGLIIEKVAEVGGHLGPNLGVVELTVALHYVFDSPTDKIVWDVSHQSYPHKILTGRRADFEETFHETGGVSGFTNKDESEHDHFHVGHTSTSVALATGLAAARDLRGEKHNVVAVIGDGSLSGGEAFEGLNVGGALGSNFIVVVNDNDMSISENYGSLYEGLRELRETGGEATNNYFKTLGFGYIYVGDGNDAAKVVGALEKVKDSKKPVVVHVHTQKGKGLKYAEDKATRENYHYIGPFDVETGQRIKPLGANYTGILDGWLNKKIAQDKNTMVIVPGMPMLGAELRKKYPKNYTDVGIAEAEAVAYASGLATGGVKPYALFAASFIQRAYDQIHQDLSLNGTAVTMIVGNGGISSADYTHAAMYDVAMLSNIPGLVYMQPTNAEEFVAMLEWCDRQDFPTAVRIKGDAPAADRPVAKIELNKYEIVHEGAGVALVGLGNFYGLMIEVADELKKSGVDATVINPRFVTGLDEVMLDGLLGSHSAVATLEDGILDGGFGQKVASYYGDKDMKVLNFGAAKEFTDRVPVDVLMERYGLTVGQIVARIQETV